MSQPIRFTELETGTQVLVSTPFTWGSDVPQFHVVAYPSGREYIVPAEELNKHFAIVSPQEVFLKAWGSIDDRPTKNQLEASAFAAAPVA